MSFMPGQRYLSETENNLGLGIVTSIEGRRVQLDFPAAQENRIYAVVEAPLTRVVLQMGDTLQHRDNWFGKVIARQEMNGLYFYLTAKTDGGEVIVPESELSPQFSLHNAKERLLAGQLDSSELFALRYRTLLTQQAQFQSPLRGLRGNRAGLIPHQLHIAQEVGNRLRPRVLLADEVGLGKTIEAGMILQNQLFAEKIRRVLIIVPENLQHQWLVEMLRRFNLPFALFDEERAADFAATEDSPETNPFESEALIICSLDWLTAYPKRAAQALAAGFDCLVVDEAHHLAWSQQQVSPQYALVERLAQAIPSVLLLTATPEQLGEESHFARLRLLDPARFYDFQAFIDEQRQYRPLADTIQALLTERPLTTQESQQLAELLPEMRETLACGLADGSSAVSARTALIQALIDRHGTGRVLFRNTRQNIKGFPQRHYHPIALSNEAAKIDWLLDFLKNHRQDKILVICHLAQTAQHLVQVLREKEGIRAALFHEGMSIVERDRAAAYFAEEEGAQVLVSSAIGSEGRNFQFSHRLVLFDLPPNPDALEQAIGRLDRIGQQQDIDIYQPYIKDSSDELLARWYHEGLDAFERLSPAGMSLFTEFDIAQRRVTGFTDFSSLLIQTRERREQLQYELEQGRDRLLEMNSAGGAQAQALAQQIAAQDGEPQLRQFAQQLFDLIGLEQDELGEHSLVIQPTGTMMFADFPGLQEEPMTVTFDRALALAREEWLFLTWDHPMIRHGIDLITANDIGKASMALLVNKQLPAGTLLMETVFVVEAQAPQGLQLGRFLPPTAIRLLLDSKGHDLSAQVSFETLQQKLKPLNKALAVKMLKTVQSLLQGLFQQAERLLAQPAQQIIDEALLQAKHELDAEFERLSALQRVNKNIRADELGLLTKQREDILHHLAGANWRLDSVRIIVTNQE